jgi:hypothetical protein
MVPGLDMLRLFIQRLSKFNNPFKPDRNHIHHYFSNKLEFSIIVVRITLPINSNNNNSNNNSNNNNINNNNNNSHSNDNFNFIMRINNIFYFY